MDQWILKRSTIPVVRPSRVSSKVSMFRRRVSLEVWKCCKLDDLVHLQSDHAVFGSNSVEVVAAFELKLPHHSKASPTITFDRLTQGKNSVLQLDTPKTLQYPRIKKR